MIKDAHLEISKKAVQIYNELYSLKSVQDKELAARFIEGSGNEDILSTLVHKFGYVFTQPVVRRSTARV
jgi:hypothetical protein